jgi:hypothetical protein
MSTSTVPIAERYLCPACFTQYSSTQIQLEWPTCPDCYSEAIEIDVIPLEKFLADTSLAMLQEWLDSWASAKGFNPEYHARRRRQIEAVIALKHDAKI